MSKINDADMAELLKEARTYLGITWNDANTDEAIKHFITTSARRLESVFGGDLDFVHGEEAYEAIAHELLISRVFYAREKALDDFDSNFRGELLNLRNYGMIKQMKDRKEDAEQQ